MQAEVAAEARRRKVELPAELLPATALYMGTELFWVAYWELRGSTPEDEPVAWTEVQAWAEASRMDDEGCALLHYHVQCLDGEYRKWRRQKLEAASKKGRGPRRMKRGRKA